MAKILTETAVYGHVSFTWALVHTSAHVRQKIDNIFQLIYYGYAYVSNSSVYFGTLSFKRQFLHDKLKLDRLHNITVLCEREEALTTTKFTSEAKKNKSDFLLWKKSEPGELS
ncbi:unnamed protein product [Rotaria socialis]|uniref:tRNA synthetases class I catalytic domain-containing protein n=1 Tax=Rotaria socialis TaxID=392032 RepID=A0A818CEZ5_9BILA|nr:unnamed protein product [Rotaria socialis]CAF3428060.1 unnamed protein product [Rotaria socialis]CAF3597299.1 unnamed protein product [Rotaria socialis]CAF3611768.1 unnamed protein product [Rotaria socialis]CAF4412545.1 unnamed protein product [Rotaria socialis]